MASCGGGAPGWVGSPAWSSTLGVGLLLARGQAQDAGAWRLKEGGLLPSRDSQGVRVCVPVCGWVGVCTYVCMCVPMCLCVCMRVWSRLASREPPALGLSGCWWVEELVPLAGRHGMKTQRAHPCSGHPSPFQAGIRLEGTAGATETPLTGPPTQGLRCSGSPGQPRPSQGKLPHPKRLLLVQLCAWLPGGFDWTERSCSLKGASETYQPDGPSISGQAMSIL